MLEKILAKDNLDQQDIIYLLKLEDKADVKRLYEKAREVKQAYVGNKVYYRGLIEFSNYCSKDCYYCGIRKSNQEVPRFTVSEAEILETAKWAYDNAYGSITLQSGERSDPLFVEFCESVIANIHKQSNQELGMTLCMGEQSKETYKRWFNAGGSRYLLRIETTNPELYEKLHPKSSLHSFEQRLACLDTLREVGFQVGTGVMIGLPDQTYEDLAKDVLFFQAKNIDMIGMGPYVVHNDTPLGAQTIEQNLNTMQDRAWRLRVSLNMIAVCRILLKDVNIAATTALQALHPLGREKGLEAGANILMPIITGQEHRKAYQLYNNKPCINDTAEHCKNCLFDRVKSVDNQVGYGEKGDSPHYYKRLQEG